ncbi:hypothetical protein Bca4012_083784 [Brassica carinata]
MYPSCPFALYGPRVKGMYMVLVWLSGGSNHPLSSPNDGIAGCKLRLVLPVGRCWTNLCSRVMIFWQVLMWGSLRSCWNHVFQGLRAPFSQDVVMFQGRRNVGEKKRWSSVRSYLCGDQFNSVLAVEDSGSIKDSVDALLTMSQQLISGSVSVKQHLENDEDSVSVKSSEVSVTQVTQPLQDKISKVVKEVLESKTVI